MTKQSEKVISHHFSSQLYQSTAPFSHFVQQGNTGYSAGIIGQDPSSGALVSSDVTAQCEAMLTNLQTLLDEMGLAMGDIIRTTLYLIDYQDFDAINTVYARRLAPPFPARTTVQAAALPLGAKVQIEATVQIPPA
ncbi:RidA family protein [Arthrobacter sp. ISL-65]|uniref:RidA family protein n=1 Tax=Arthrobacter sp. ISL-65 TaxID=2819112 RepID=UPI001BEBC3AE|nr:RidA family protein [Arthrobacter sp. ISL-65]MBT2550095.1 RidA family protein [Arthrobacter sp. ISL-65]